MVKVIMAPKEPKMKEEKKPKKRRDRGGKSNKKDVTAAVDAEANAGTAFFKIYDDDD